MAAVLFCFRTDAESDTYVTGGFMVAVKRGGSSKRKQDVRIGMIKATQVNRPPKVGPKIQL